ncbi:uncharacterized protein LOC131061840 isoform X3 [Cryptomeria japonica]|uniref:uncharacterized protein LOC131061840 isoform X3 n=1 Tax=Cryptomeria japonica TaxID=3369 RepID=UPI0027DAAB2C|nr:uncharacterized protein LOC131061840 isoform X3 [Cryptomeria japonica]
MVDIWLLLLCNKNSASPQVYHETDQCVSSIKGYESEDPIVFPSVYEDRNLFVSHSTPGKGSMHNFCNIAMPLAHNGPVITSASAGLPKDETLQSNSIIIESNPKLSERQYSEISPLVHQEKHSSVYGLIPGKDLLQNIGNISTPLALVGPVMTHVSTGIGREERQNNTKLLGQSFQPLAKKRFFEKDLAESTESPKNKADNEHNFHLAEAKIQSLMHFIFYRTIRIVTRKLRVCHRCIVPVIIRSKCTRKACCKIYKLKRIEKFQGKGLLRNIGNISAP